MITKNKIRGRGYWLASVMLGGPIRKESEPGHGPLFDSKRKHNTNEMVKPNFKERGQDGKQRD